VRGHPAQQSGRHATNGRAERLHSPSPLLRHIIAESIPHGTGPAPVPSRYQTASGSFRLNFSADTTSLTVATHDG
jgi:hypothetical protein